VAGNGAPAAARDPRPAAARRGRRPAASEPTPIRGPAATLARFMNESRSIPTATSFRTSKVEVLDERRRALKAAGRRLSFTHLIAWAIVEAAREMPEMAQAYTEIDGKPHLVPPAGINLGLAVDVERRNGTRSLVTPVLQGADALDFPAFVAATTSSWPARGTTRCRPRPTPGRTSPSRTRAASGRSRPCLGSCPARGRSSPRARSATRRA
jgi:2-oxoglutarate dehydrogenase E1 component